MTVSSGRSWYQWAGSRVPVASNAQTSPADFQTSHSIPKLIWWFCDYLFEGKFKVPTHMTLHLQRFEFQICKIGNINLVWPQQWISEDMDKRQERRHQEHQQCEERRLSWSEPPPFNFHPRPLARRWWTVAEKEDNFSFNIGRFFLRARQKWGWRGRWQSWRWSLLRWRSASACSSTRLRRRCRCTNRWILPMLSKIPLERDSNAGKKGWKVRESIWWLSNTIELKYMHPLQLSKQGKLWWFGDTRLLKVTLIQLCH